MRRSTMRAVCALALIATTISLPARSQNIYVDPGFEATGVAGQARSGSRAGRLAVGGRNHWDALGGRISVQPFARYRVTCWAKANVRSGTFFAPYCYEWDSYEWAFVSSPQIMPGEASDWTRMVATFVSPHSTMYVHPLAYMDAENSEAWVDDIVVEKIDEPEAVMREIAANAAPNETETRLLVRWYARRGRLADGEALLRGSEGLLRADIATVLALAARKPADRRRLAAEAVASGGPSYHEGVERFHAMTSGVGIEEKMAVVVSGLAANPSYDRAARAAELVINSLLAAPTGPMTLAARRNRTARLRRALESAMSTVPRGSAAERALHGSVARLAADSAEIERERAKLGACIVTIGGKKVAPATHAIVTPDTSTPEERYAAAELRSHLELVTGCALPLVAESKLGKASGLFVGACKKNAPLLKGLAPEGLHVKVVGTGLCLAGRGRGALYAVYALLEDQIGCRWFTPDCRTWPRTGRIAIDKLDRRLEPSLEYRGGDYPVARPGEFAARLRLNGANHAVPPEMGGHLGVQSLAHTFAALCPPERYFAEHPEYFSLVKGQRQSGYAQLCLTNPDVLRICIDGVRQWIKDMPGTTVFSVSQNDAFNYCECANCSAIAEEEGSQAGPMIRFVNAVADAIGKDHPNVAIETLAYQYTRKPPKITKPRPNVIVCLCSIECCFVHPLADDPFNASFVEDIKGWNRICKRLWIWDYIINYAHSICPFPNLYVLKPNIKFFIENGVRGVYEESCYYTKGSELQELRNYVMAKLLWDPSYDTDKAIDEFCAAYYGPAGRLVRRYVDLIHKVGREDPARHVTIYTHPRLYVTPAMLAEAKTLFDQAEEAVREDPVLLHRVEVARLPILYAEITLAQSGVWVERDGSLAQEGATDLGALADRFARIARAEGVTMVREGGPDAGLDAWLARIPRRPNALRVERLRGGGLEADILPGLGGRLWRLRRTSDGRDLIAVAGSAAGWLPSDHGYEEYSESGYRSAGWQEPYTLRERTERAAVLESDLANGLRLTRRIELGAVQPQVSITSTILNVSGAARSACLRIHPAFASTLGQGTRVDARRADGSGRSIELTVPGGLAEADLWLRGDDVPDGEWSIVDPAAGIRITNTFDRGQVTQCLLNWSTADHRVNLELFSHEKELAPGESLTLSHTYQIGSAE